jgi:hypothetical protein
VSHPLHAPIRVRRVVGTCQHEPIVSSLLSVPVVTGSVHRGTLELMVPIGGGKGDAILNVLRSYFGALSKRITRTSIRSYDRWAYIVY